MFFATSLSTALQPNCSKGNPKVDLAEKTRMHAPIQTALDAITNPNATGSQRINGRQSQRMSVAKTVGLESIPQNERCATLEKGHGSDFSQLLPDPTSSLSSSSCSSSSIANPVNLEDHWWEMDKQRQEPGIFHLDPTTSSQSSSGCSSCSTSCDLVLEEHVPNLFEESETDKQRQERGILSLDPSQLEDKILLPTTSPQSSSNCSSNGTSCDPVNLKEAEQNAEIAKELQKKDLRNARRREKRKNERAAAEYDPKIAEKLAQERKKSTKRVKAYREKHNAELNAKRQEKRKNEKAAAEYDPKIAEKLAKEREKKQNQNKTYRKAKKLFPKLESG